MGSREVIRAHRLAILGKKEKKKSFVTEERFGKLKERNEKEQRENLSHHRPRETRQRPPLIIIRDKTQSWFGKAQ